MLGRIVGQPHQHIGKPSSGIYAVELGGLDQRVDGCGTPAAFIGTREGPVVTPDSNTTQRPLRGVVTESDAPIVEESAQRRPALEAVVDRLGGLTLAG